MSGFNLNPAFLGNLKVPRHSGLRALQSPRAFTTLMKYSGGFSPPGFPNGNGQANATQYASPFDTNFSAGALDSGPFQPGLYDCLLAAGPAITHANATLTDTDGNFFLLADLQIDFDPDALPDGILSATQVVNGIINNGAAFESYALSGWRFIFDSTVIIGSDDYFNPSLNLVTSELGSLYTGQVTLQSHWNYFFGNPRLAKGGAHTLNWFDDSPPIGLDHWQLQGLTAITNWTNIATYPAGTMTMTDSGLFGLWTIFQIFGCDAAGNQITPTSNTT